jgi:serine/threonine-protein kinase
MYVTENQNHYIRKLSLSTNAMTTVAGTGIRGNTDGVGGLVEFPTGIAYDSSVAGGRLYFAAPWCVRTLTLSTGNLDWFVGDCASSGYAEGTGMAAKFTDIAGLLLHPTNGKIYLAVQNNNRLRSVDIASATSSLEAGSGTAAFADGTGAAASFNQPTGIAFNSDATKIYIVEAGNHRVRVFTIATKAVTTLAGSGTAALTDGVGAAAAFNTPYGIALSPSGMLYVADFGNNKARIVDPATGAVTTVPKYDASGPVGVVIEPSSAAVYYLAFGANCIAASTFTQPSASPSVTPTRTPAVSASSSPFPAPAGSGTGSGGCSGGLYYYQGTFPNCPGGRVLAVQADLPPTSALCSIMSAGQWSIGNGADFTFKGSGYGCTFVTYTTSGVGDVFCC